MIWCNRTFEIDVCFTCQKYRYTFLIRYNLSLIPYVSVLIQPNRMFHHIESTKQQDFFFGFFIYSFEISIRNVSTNTNYLTIYETQASYIFDPFQMKWYACICFRIAQQAVTIYKEILIQLIDRVKME